MASKHTGDVKVTLFLASGFLLFIVSVSRIIQLSLLGIPFTWSDFFSIWTR